MIRTMALDVGNRRIGIAISDALGMTIQGRPTLTRTNVEADIKHIRRLVTDNEVGHLVVGHPLHMDGAASPQSEKTEAFAERLKKVLRIPVALWDERLTSFAAEQHLEELGLDWRERRRHVDELAAVLILEDYLGTHS